MGKEWQKEEPSEGGKERIQTQNYYRSDPWHLLLGQEYCWPMAGDWALMLRSPHSHTYPRNEQGGPWPVRSGWIWVRAQWTVGPCPLNFLLCVAGRPGPMAQAPRECSPCSLWRSCVMVPQFRTLELNFFFLRFFSIQCLGRVPPVMGPCCRREHLWEPMGSAPEW